MLPFIVIFATRRVVDAIGTMRLIGLVAALGVLVKSGSAIDLVVGDEGQ